MNTANKKDFMKDKGTQPNDCCGCVDTFVAQFNREFEEVFEEISKETIESDF
tara:strand:- start:388 stop:543 length:156 start_codon:yes stop_codon:yes gene_type:complete